MHYNSQLLLHIYRYPGSYEHYLHFKWQRLRVLRRGLESRLLFILSRRYLRNRAVHNISLTEVFYASTQQFAKTLVNMELQNAKLLRTCLALYIAYVNVVSAIIGPFVYVAASDCENGLTKVRKVQNGRGYLRFHRVIAAL